MSKKIKNIVFDLGGVVIDLDRDEAVRRLEKIGLGTAGELLGLYRQEEPFLSLETGRCTAAELYDGLRGQCSPGTTDHDIEEAFCGFLIGIPEERLRALSALREAGFRVFALSNTNPVMYNGWIAREFRKLGLSVNDYFEGVVASFAEGTCKPDEEIFRIVLRRYGLNGDETLMLDDSDANCQAAERAGMRSHRIDNRSREHSMTAVAGTLIKEGC